MTASNKAILSLFSAFILGFACCFFLFYFSVLEHRHTPRHSRNMTADLVTQFTIELDLSADQQEFLRKQLQIIQVRHDEIRQNTDSQFMKLREEFRQTFSSVLTPEQQKKFIEYNRKRDEQRKR